MHYSKEDLKRAEQAYRRWQRWRFLLLALFLVALLLWAWLMLLDAPRSALPRLPPHASPT